MENIKKIRDQELNKIHKSKTMNVVSKSKRMDDNDEHVFLPNDISSMNLEKKAKVS